MPTTLRTHEKTQSACPPTLAVTQKGTRILDGHVCYYEGGQSRRASLLLLHGMTTSADSLLEVMDALAADYHVIAPDMPGFGGRDQLQDLTLENLSEWLEAFCQNTGLLEFGLVGHSFGGAIALCFAAQYPERTTRILLGAPPIFSGQKYPVFVKRLARRVCLFELVATLSKSRLLVQRRVREPFYRPDQVLESVFDRRQRDYKRARASADALKILAFTDFEARLRQIDIPVCLVWGENDRVVSLEEGMRLAAILNIVRFESIAGCGHVSVSEKPEKFAALARAFFYPVGE